MKKIALFSLALCFVMAFIMVGCGSSGSSVTTTTTTATTTSTTTSTMTPTLLTVSGTLSFAVPYSTTEASALALWRTKSDINTLKIMTYEAVYVSSTPISYTFSYVTTEALPFTCYLTASHPTGAGFPSFVAAPGVTQDDSQTNDLNNLQPITFEASHTSLTVNLVLYTITP